MKSNGIKRRKVEGKRNSMREEATKFEKLYANKASREAEEGEEHRRAKRNGARDKTHIYNG